MPLLASTCLESLYLQILIAASHFSCCIIPKGASTKLCTKDLDVSASAESLKQPVQVVA